MSAQTSNKQQKNDTQSKWECERILEVTLRDIW